MKRRKTINKYAFKDGQPVNGPAPSGEIDNGGNRNKRKVAAALTFGAMVDMMSRGYPPDLIEKESNVIKTIKEEK